MREGMEVRGGKKMVYLQSDREADGVSTVSLLLLLLLHLRVLREISRTGGAAHTHLREV